MEEMIKGMNTNPPLGNVNDTYSGGEGPPMVRMMIV
jgi:hypothetical protein